MDKDTGDASHCWDANDVDGFPGKTKPSSRGQYIVGESCMGDSDSAQHFTNSVHHMLDYRLGVASSKFCTLRYSITIEGRR